MSHALAGTAANVSDLYTAGSLLRGEEEEVFDDAGAERVEKMRASIRANVEHLFRVIKCQCGITMVLYR